VGAAGVVQRTGIIVLAVGIGRGDTPITPQQNRADATDRVFLVVV
jgi:hypothetical protein